MSSITHTSFTPEQKLIVFKTPNGNKLLAKFNKKTDTVGDAMHTLRNIMKFSLQSYYKEESYILRHQEHKITNETLLDKISNNLICELLIVDEQCAKDMDFKNAINKSTVIQDAKKYRQNMTLLHKSKTRSSLRKWAMDHNELGIHGNSKSAKILYVISERYLNRRQIFVKSLTGKSITLEVTNDTYILEIMSSINRNEGIPPDQQKLCYGGQVLAPFEKLFGYVGGDVKEHTLHLVLRLRGGMYDEKSGRDGKYSSLSTILDKIFTVQRVNESNDVEIEEVIELSSSLPC